MNFFQSPINAVIRFLSSYREALDRILQYPLAIILVMTGLTGFFLWNIPNLKIATSIYDLVIEDLPETRQYEKFTQQFGSNEIIRVVIKSGGVFQETTFEKIRVLAEDAAKIKGVQRVVSLPGVKKAVDIGDKMTLKEFSAIIGPAELFQKNLVSTDGKTTVLTLVLENEADPEAVIRSVEVLIDQADPALSLYQIGMPLVSSALARFTQTDFYRLPLITFVLITLVLLALYRRVTYVLLPIVCVLASLVWTFGLMAIVDIPLSMLTMIIPVFLIAVGTAYCLHIMSEYLAVKQTADTPEEAVSKTFATVTFPTAIAAFTTVIGLGSLLVNRISAIQEFAVVACLGIFSFVIILLTLLPSILMFLPLAAVKAGPSKPSSGSLIDGLIEWIIRLNLDHQKTVLPVVGAIALVCLAGIFRLQVETNPVGYFREDTAIRRHFHDIYRDLSGSFPLNVVMKSPSEDYFERPGAVASLAKLQAFLETLPGVDKSVSFADYMKLVNYATNRFEKEYYVLPTESYEVRMLINSYKTLLGREMLTPFMKEDFSTAHILLFTHISSSRQFLETRQAILAYVKDHFSKDLEWEVTGFGVVISASSHHLTRGQVKSLSLTLVMVFVIMFSLFLSVKVGLITIVPNIFPIIINFGLMGWFGIELSMATSLIASIAIGLAVDDTIHYLVRYNHEFRKDLDDRRALKATIRHIGRPILFTTLTISIGFSILVFSSFKPTAVFGLMMMITMLAALVGDLIILPSMILHVDLVTVWDLVRLKMGMEPRFGIPLFQGLSRIQVYYILMAGALKKLDAGQVLFQKAAPSDSMYAVISGRLNVYDHAVGEDSAGGQHGMRKFLAEIKKGDIVGEMGLVRGAPRSATVIATESSELLYVNWKMIERLHWLSPGAARRFNTNLLAIICDRMDRITRDLYDTCVVDDQTGLTNRKGFVEALEMETRRFWRYGSRFVLCLIRIHFPGPDHPFAPDERDRVIRQISRILLQETRKSNTLARISFDTFVLLIPGKSMEGAQQAAERLVRVLAPERAEPFPIRITHSFILPDQIQDSDGFGECLLQSIERQTV